MSKKTKHRKRLGRHEVVGAGELLERYRAIRDFLWHEWGRIGLDLKRARNPDGIRTNLTRVPGVQWYPAFRDCPAVCLLEQGTAKVDWREVRLTRKEHERAKATVNRLQSEYQSAWREFQRIATAVNSVASESERNAAAGELHLRELEDSCKRGEVSLKETQKEEEAIRTRLNSQEAWYARNEVVRFVRKPRYHKTPVNFAKVMAGLPDYSWLRSLRKCNSIRVPPTVPPSRYLLWDLLETIVQGMKRLDKKKIEMKLQKELLQSTDIFLKNYVAPNWLYMKQALAYWRGKRFRRDALSYKIMGRFLDNVEKPNKTLIEAEIAKREQLVIS